MSRDVRRDFLRVLGVSAGAVKDLGVAPRGPVGRRGPGDLVHELRAFTGLTPGELARQGDFAFFQDAGAPGG